MKGKRDNKIKQAKQRLRIKIDPNPPLLPDLNPIEKIWRIIKQRLKSRGVFYDTTELRHAIEEEWDAITLDDINKAISNLPNVRDEVEKRHGMPTQYQIDQQIEAFW